MARKMKDSGVEWIGEIPECWNLLRLQNILIERNEKNNPIKTKNILSLTIEKGVIPYSEKTGGGNKAKEDLTAYKLAYPNDIVLNSMNIIAGSVGISKYFGCMSPVYYAFFSNERNNINYYHQVFQSTEFQKSLLGLGNGIMMKESSNGKLNTIRLRIPSEKLKKVYLPVPPLDKQKKIADYLDGKILLIKELIMETNNSIAELKKYRESLIIETVIHGLEKNKKLKESGIDWVGEIPEKWKVIKAKYVLNKHKRTITNSEIVTAFRDGEVTQRKNRRTTGFTMADKESGYQGIKRGDLVIHGMDAFAGAIGVSDSDGKSSPVYIVCTPKFDDNIYYIAYLFKVYAKLGYIESMAIGIRERSTDFKWPVIKNTPLILPSKFEQDLIVEFLDEKISHINKLIDEKRQLISEFEIYKKSLIYEYATGKKEVL